MKKYICSLFTTDLLVLAAGCSKDDDGPKNVDSGVVGEWHLAEWTNESHTDFDVYIEFRSDATFNIYEKVETSAYVRYSGESTVKETYLSGRYSSGLPWSADYTFELSNEGKTLTMTSATDTPEVSIYIKSSIPEAMRNAPQVRSALPEGFGWML